MRGTLNGFAQLARPLNCLIVFISIFLGGAVTGAVHPFDHLFLAALSGLLIMAGGNAINDFFDLEIDRINKPRRPLPSGIVRPGIALVYALVLSFFGIFLSLFINPPCVFIAIVTALLLFIYSWKLKRTVLWGNFTVAFFSGLAFVYGGLAVNRMREALLVGVFSFLFHFAREIIKDIEDMEGDTSDGVVTLPIRYGIHTTRIWISAILILLIIATLIPYFYGFFNRIYLITVLIGVDCFVGFVLIKIFRPCDSACFGKIAFWMKLDMFIGLLAVFLGR